MTSSTTIGPTIVAMMFASATASAAPIAPLSGVPASPATAVQFRGGNWGDHPLMYRGNWEWHQRQWDAIEGRGVNAGAGATRCSRFRSYDRRSHSYVNRSGRRVPCP
jgi:hypothetical protein